MTGSLRRRLRLVEKELGVNAKWYVDVMRQPGESRENALRRTLSERGIQDEDVGAVVYWPNHEEGSQFEYDIRVEDCDVSKLAGYVSFDDRLARIGG